MTGISREEAIELGNMLYVAVNRSSPDPQAARGMIEAGAYLCMANPEGITTLMCACAGGHTGIVQAMLESGRDAALEAQDSHGWTALITAAHRADAGTLRVLLQAGANPAARDEMGRDALYYAKGSKDAEKIKVIEDALNTARIMQDATKLAHPVSVRKPLQYKP